ncbi:MAG: hypothetical protein Q9186_004637 [Xanthomendoza sp. 1 TL-2023]
MNGIREIQRLNKLELENAVSPEASWHRDHADSAYIYIGGLPFDLSEGDIVTIFSQYGEPTFVRLVRDKETGKSKGFAFLKYEDQRSTDLAVDNLGGATVMGRMLKVDHTKYKKRDGEDEEEELPNQASNEKVASDTEEEERRPMLREEKELAALLRDQDEDDPMKEYLVQEKKAEVARALAKLKRGDKKVEEKKKHRHSHKHRPKRGPSDSDSGYDRRRHKHRSRRDSDQSEKEEEKKRRHHSNRRRSRSPE